ncbi:MAG: Trm112 family protein [Gammaproteobacteria bacterium]
MSFDKNLLDIICCPVTRLPMSAMSTATLAKLNGLIQEQKIRDRDDTVVTEELQEALVTDDGQIAYPVVDGIPVLLEERGISLSQLDAS